MGQERVNPRVTSPSLYADVKRTFGPALYRAREDAGLSRGELAEKVHKSGSAIKSYELGKVFPKFGTFLRICEFVNQPPAYFFEESYSKRPGPTKEEILADLITNQVVGRLEGILKPSDEAIKTSVVRAVDHLASTKRRLRRHGARRGAESTG
jgi:transcriptional regulator with XRE-family HTH domain